MATNTGEIAGVGDVYAQALLEAANEAGRTDEVAEQFDDLIRYMDQDGDFDRFMVASTVDDEVRRSTLERLFRGRMDDLLLNLLQVLNDRGRSELLRQVHERFRLRLEEQRQQVEVEVITAVPLGEEVLGRLTAMLSERIGRQAIAVPRVEESLIGGLVVQVGDRRLDASMARQLACIRERLLGRASAEIHQGRRYIAE